MLLESTHWDVCVLQTTVIILIVSDSFSLTLLAAEMETADVEDRIRLLPPRLLLQ
jgi:hypothetical protein